MKTIRFIIEYDIDGDHDWSVGGMPNDLEFAEMHPVPKELQNWLPHILATMLRDCVVPKGPTIHTTIDPKARDGKEAGP